MRRDVEEKGPKLSITDGGREGRAKSSRHAAVWKRSFRTVTREKEWVLHPAFETLGVDLRRRTKQLGAQEKARREKIDVRLSLARRNRVFQKNCMRVGVRMVLGMGLVLARLWRGQAVGISPTERLQLRRQMAAAAGKKESVSFLFLQVNGLQVEKDVFTMATLLCPYSFVFFLF